MRSTFNAAETFKFAFTNLLRFASMFYYAYILQSFKDGSFYIGYTSDLVKRVKQHNNGESLATKPFRPYKLIFYEAFLNEKDAKAREEYLKSGYGRKTIKTMLKNFITGVTHLKSFWSEDEVRSDRIPFIGRCYRGVYPDENRDSSMTETT